MHFIFKHFQQLTTQELYAMLQLREEVFQIEQNCIYKDIDDKDLSCWHLLLYEKEILVAYCRILPKTISYENYVSIGRVVSKTSLRKKGLGKMIMTEALKQLNNLFPQIPIKISAQAYLQQFYSAFGFVCVSDEYMEDNIPHIAMVKEK